MLTKAFILGIKLTLFDKPYKQGLNTNFFISIYVYDKTAYSD